MNEHGEGLNQETRIPNSFFVNSTGPSAAILKIIANMTLKIQFENQSNTCQCKVSLGGSIDRVLMRVSANRNLQFRISIKELQQIEV